MEYLIDFPSLSRLWNSLYASAKRIERAPKVREFNPWEVVEIVPRPEISGPYSLTVPSHLGEFL